MKNKRAAKISNGLLVFLAIVIFSTTALAAKPVLVKAVKVKGNQRIGADAILRVVQTKPGDVYNPAALSADLKAIYKMGYFSDVRVSVDKAKDGDTVIFTVTERPTIREIDFSGNSVFKAEKLKENIDISSGSILNIYALKRNVMAIETLYKDKNYQNVSVKYKIKDLPHNQADVEFVIHEGEKVRVEKITFDGNHAYSDKILKKQIKTDTAGWFSWLTSSGELNRQTLQQDIIRLSDFYRNHGYAEARVSDPDIVFKKKGIYITIKIHEGPRFTIGKVAFKGDLIFPKEELFKKIGIDQQKYYNQEVLRNDVMTISDMYADKGYARADVYPDITREEKKKVINIVFNIQKNHPIYFQRIEIKGNTKTRDKVIRRELTVFEQERYNASQLKRSVRNLYRLDYFEDVKVKTLPGSSPDKMVLDLDVKEKPTGTFSFGAGYSAVDKLYVMGSVSERNFLGRGQILQLSVQTGGVSRNYSASFTEPWLFDIPLSMTVDAYSAYRDYDYYERHSTGGDLQFGYPIFDYTRAYIAYGYDNSRVTSVQTGYQYLIAAGRLTESSVTVGLVYDSRDRAINPTEGSYNRLSLQYAGLWGNVGFEKLTGEAGHYFPLFWGTVFFLHTEAGYVHEVSGKYLPDYEKFYLGGINSLRGFDWHGVSAYDANGNPIGGDKYIQGNAEFIFPIIKKAGLMGVGFYDTGNVYKKGASFDLGNLRRSAGFGIRWFSPLGPIRLERGYILDRKKGESSGRWEFAIGGAFQ